MTTTPPPTGSPSPTPTGTPTPTPTPTAQPNNFDLIGSETLKPSLLPVLNAGVNRLNSDLTAYLDSRFPLVPTTGGGLSRNIPSAKIVVVNIIWRTFQRLAGNPIIRELAREALNKLFDLVFDKITEVLEGQSGADSAVALKPCLLGTFVDGNLITLNPNSQYVAIEFINLEDLRQNAISVSFGNFNSGTAINLYDAGFINFVGDGYLGSRQELLGVKSLYKIPENLPSPLAVSVLPKVFLGMYRVIQYLPVDTPSDQCLPVGGSTGSSSPSATPSPTAPPSPPPTST